MKRYARVQAGLGRLRVIEASLDNARLEVVEYDAPGHAIEELEGVLQPDSKDAAMHFPLSRAVPFAGWRAQHTRFQSKRKGHLQCVA